MWNFHRLNTFNLMFALRNINECTGYCTRRRGARDLCFRHTCFDVSYQRGYQRYLLHEGTVFSRLHLHNVCTSTPPLTAWYMCSNRVHVSHSNEYTLYIRRQFSSRHRGVSLCKMVKAGLYEFFTGFVRFVILCVTKIFLSKFCLLRYCYYW